MRPSVPTLELRKGNRVHGFLIDDIVPLPDLRAAACLATHEKSGARLLHLVADDPDNLFAVAFRTPPPDDTGLPHILEHTVLCGSEKYPVKDPFVELLKTSLATFLNAMTYPDKTVYPCASMNERDFFNLADVYCDAVFHPLLTEKHFKQEGHHLDFASPGDVSSPLVIKGIVYNEMKGAYSDLDGLMQHKTTRSLFPDNAYGMESGGAPDAIPSLTYEQFVRFHRTFYHPANSLFFVYGGIPTERHLAFLDTKYLSGFDHGPIDTTIADQPRWTEPRRKVVPYPIGPSEETARKTAVVLTFFANEVTDAVTTLSMHLVGDYLLGNAASPLRKALIDSRLGEELVESGYFSYQRDTFLCVGLKGTEEDRTEAIVDLVLRTCRELAEQGLEKGKVEAAFHRLEIASREIRPRYPLLLMDRVYRSWLYGADPLMGLRLNEHLGELRQRYASEPGFFERQIARWITDNPHYTVLTFTPDRDYMAKKDAAYRKRLAERKATMDSASLEAVAREAAELDAMQSAPNTPEALATLPRLGLSDVPPEPFELETSREEVARVPLLHTDIFANGLSYLQLAFDLRGIDEDLVDYLPLYAEALTQMGAAGFDYAAMAEREAAHTGGVGAGVSVGGRADDCHHVRPLFLVSARALDSKLPQMLEIVSDRLLRCDLTDLDRLRDVVLQGRIHRQSDIIPSGNHYAHLFAARHLSRNSALAERLAGISQLRVYNRLADGFDNDRDAVAERLSRLRDFLLARGRLAVSFVGDEEQRPTLDSWLAGVTEQMREECPPEESSVFEPTFRTREGIATPAEVAFVAKALPAVPSTHPDAPVLLLLGVHLSFGYLWTEVRVKQGAYGARASYDSGNGVFSFTSYRDPCIRETLAAFEGSFQHVATKMDLSEEAVEQAVIGTVKILDQVVRPGQAVSLALGRELRGETPEIRKRFRQRLLSLTGEDIRRVAVELLGPRFDDAPACVLSSRERLAAANDALGDQGLAIEDL